MRIHLHDFSGHPFQNQLARELAKRGHEVLYSYCPQYVTGRGRLDVDDAEAANLSILAIRAPRELEKYRPVKRIEWEIGYASAWIAAFDRRTDVVILCNVPLVAHARIHHFLRKSRVPVVFWHQDVYSLAISDEVARKLPLLSSPVAWGFQQIERHLVATSTAVVAIGDQFVQQYRVWGLDAKAEVIPNWAPLDEIVPTSRDNAWAEGVGLTSDAVRLMYSGTLGRKHNPGLLVELIDEVRSRGVEAELIVVSEGVGADDIRASAQTRPYVRVLPFVPAEGLSEMMGAADVLVAILEPEASQFSVPSKVLSYLASGRPILALAPRDNRCATDVTAGGGFVAAPTSAGVLDGAAWIEKTLQAPEQVAEIGAHARRYAEEKFEIERIVDRFEAVLSQAARAS